MEAHRTLVSRECQVSCGKILKPRASVERFASKTNNYGQDCEFLGWVALAAPWNLYDHVLTKMQRDKGEESHCYPDRHLSCCSWSGQWRRQGQGAAVPRVSSSKICQKLQGYVVESLVQFIDEDYKLYASRRKKRACREEWLKN
ncbi:hypothetical protein GWK47_049671 [Chionoecetes opilio]|uniref:Uncharacterized protein n=1 Tax=Chionoecetes opilio TaxID=41210 RepID=A0A8J4YEH8_CHIOP|nr:hypothetical protein GWK47_049671 [Chionoecetes opilio]